VLYSRKLSSSNVNEVLDQIRRRIDSENTCYFLRLVIQFLYESLRDWIYIIQFVLFFCMSVKYGLLLRRLSINDKYFKTK
jgi:hypothetical protein